MSGGLRLTYTYENDTTNPTIEVTGPGGELGCNPTAGEIDAATAATADDNCEGGVTLTPFDVRTPLSGCRVTLTRTWTARDCAGNTSTATAPSVTFTEDTQGPSLTLTKADADLGCNPSEADILAALGEVQSVSDLCTGSSAAPSTENVINVDACHRSQTRTFTATDQCQNTTTKTVTVTWTEDDDPPVIQFTGSTDELGCDPTQAQIEEAMRWEILDCSGLAPVGGLSFSVSTITDGCERTHTRGLTARDRCGNTSFRSRTITWHVSGGAPVIAVNGPTSPGCNPTAEQIDAAFGTASATGGCGTVTIDDNDGPVTSSGCTRTQTRTWTAEDACGTEATGVSRTISWTVDTTKPTITGVSANPQFLWPPNHTMRDVEVSYSAVETDGCTGAVTTKLSVSSNEPINGTGDGDTAPDWEIVDNHVRLRAERAGTGTGRIYTITITATDACGNVQTATVPVVVAHNITNPVSGNAVKVGTAVNFAGTFWDVPGKRHTAQWTFDNLATTGTVVEPSGLKPGTAAGKYTFSAAGVYKVALNLTDQTGAKTSVNTAGDLEAIAVVYDASAGYTIGGGWYASPAGAYTAAPGVAGKVSYGFTSKYFKGASNPKGELQFEFKQAGLEFNAINYDYLVVSGVKAQFKGMGKLNGGNVYDFVLTVVDGQLSGGGGTDKIRMKIWSKNTGAVIYDSQRGASDAADPALAVGAGSSVVIKTTTIAVGPVASGPSTGDEVAPDAQTAAIHAYELSAVRPNPFHTSTEMHYALPARSQVELSVYDVRGARVRTLVDAIEEPGARSVRFDSGTLEAGVYFVRMRAKSVDDPARQFSEVRKILMVK